MKAIIGLIIGALAASAAVYIMVSKYDLAKFEKERALLSASWSEERARLEAALAEANSKNRSVNPTPIIATTPAQDDPKNIIEKLAKLHPGQGDARRKTLKQVIHQLEQLSECGPGAVPAIREFLLTKEDVNYFAFPEDTQSTNQFGPMGGPPGAQQQFRRMMFMRNQNRGNQIVPQSLRLGLIETLQEIGGPQAESVLAEIISTTSSGPEIYAIAQALNTMAPGKYNDLILNTARGMLASLSAMESTPQVEETKAYLYQVLAMFKDTGFAQTAQTMLIGADGRLDRDALNYLTQTLGEQALPLIQQALNDPRLTNGFERASLMASALQYVGKNATANQMFSEIIANQSLPVQMRAFAIQSLAGGGGRFGRGNPMMQQNQQDSSDPQTIQSRIQLLNNMKSQTTEQPLVNAIDNTINRLNQQLNPQQNQGRNRFQRQAGNQN
jgi:hypothetical protein